MAQLGFIPLIIPAVSLALSFFGGKKEKEAGQVAAKRQAAAEAIASGQATSAITLLTEQDKATLRKAWPTIRVAAKFSDINWQAIGFPRGHQLSQAGKTAIETAWPEIRSAAQFNHIQWGTVAIPNEVAAPYLRYVPDFLDPVVASNSRQTFLALGIGGAALVAALLLSKGR